jgi:hypothetical protein
MIHRYYAGKVGWAETINYQSNCPRFNIRKQLWLRIPKGIIPQHDIAAVIKAENTAYMLYFF